jgi:hypothetical protein
LVFLVVSFLLAFPPISYMHSSFPICATCPAHLILLDLIILIEESLLLEAVARERLLEIAGWEET